MTSIDLSTFYNKYTLAELIVIRNELNAIAETAPESRTEAEESAHLVQKEIDRRIQSMYAK